MANWLASRITTNLPGAEPAPPERPRRTWLLVIPVIAVVAALTVWAQVAKRPSRGETPTAETVRTATIARRDFVRSVRINGTVEAVESHMVAAPRLAGQNLGSLVITRLTPGGSAVKRGDLLVEFDRQSQVKVALDRQAEFRDFVEQIKKKQADNDAARAKDDTELKQAEDALEAAKLDMLKNEILARIDIEKNQLNLEEAQARLKQLRETYELKRRAAQADVRGLEIQRDRAESAMRHAEGNAEKLAVHAPVDGVVVLSQIWKGGQMGEAQEGDEVRAGLPFLQVVNPAAMQVRARTNQADVSILHVGQPVTVRLDAYPEMVFPGKLEQLAAIGTTSGLSAKVRYFSARISVQGSDPKLTPDLSAAVDVELERRPSVLVAPRDAPVQEDGRWYLRVQRGASFEKREVKFGPVSDTEVVIESGVEAGAVVLRGSPSESEKP